MAEFTKVILTKNLVKTKVQCAALCSKNNFANQDELCNAFQFTMEKLECKIGNLNLHHMSINGNEEVIKSYQNSIHFQFSINFKSENENKL